MIGVERSRNEVGSPANPPNNNTQLHENDDKLEQDRKPLNDYAYPE
jgi:hypothetical protein